MPEQMFSTAPVALIDMPFQHLINIARCLRIFGLILRKKVLSALGNMTFSYFIPGHLDLFAACVREDVCVGMPL